MKLTSIHHTAIGLNAQFIEVAEGTKPAGAELNTRPMGSAAFGQISE